MDISTASISLFGEIKTTLDSCLSTIDEYSNTFKQEYFFTFSNPEQKFKIYADEYRKFSAIFISYFDSLGSYATQISSLLLEADRNGDLEAISPLKSAFEAYLLVEKSFYEYSKSVEKELSKNNPSISCLTLNLSKLKLSICSFYEKL